MFEQVSVEPPSSRLRLIGRALPRVGLAVFFALVGYSKFNSDPHSEWVQIFERIGVGQWLRYVTGLMQIGGAIARRTNKCRVRTDPTTQLHITLASAQSA